MAYGNDVSYHNHYAAVDVYASGKNVKVVVADNGDQKNYGINATIKWAFFFFSIIHAEKRKMYRNVKTVYIVYMFVR
mgnify:CR=1 FL=1